MSFWFPKWRSLKPQKGHLWIQTRPRLEEAGTCKIDVSCYEFVTLATSKGRQQMARSHPLRLTAKWGNPVQREWHSPERSQRNNQSSSDINKVNFAFNKIYKKKTTQTPDTACPAVVCHQKITNQSNLYDVTITIPSGPLDRNIYLQKYH